MSSFYDGVDYDVDEYEVARYNPDEDEYDFFDDAMTEQYPAVDNCPGQVFPAPRGGDDDDDNICVEKCDNGNLPENYRHGGFQCYNGYAFSTPDVMAYERTIRKLTLVLKDAKENLEDAENARNLMIPEKYQNDVVGYLYYIHNGNKKQIMIDFNRIKTIENIYRDTLEAYNTAKSALQNAYLRGENGEPFIPKPKARSLPQVPEFGLPPPPSRPRRRSRRLPQAPQSGMPPGGPRRPSRILPRHR